MSGPRDASPALPIEQHGIIGDQTTAALVAADGSLDFLCWPRFDAPSVFASLLDRERGGHFSLAPTESAGRRTQLYLPDTNLLLTRFLFEEGVAETCDFMVMGDASGAEAPTLVRRVKSIRGEIELEARCAPRFDYGRRGHRLEVSGGRAVFEPEGGDLRALRLVSSEALEASGRDAACRFRLRHGESAWFVLEPAGSGESGFRRSEDVTRAFKATMNHWRQWIARCTYRGRWQETVRRSALTLKLLQSREHGSFVASATFGLPEEIGGERNWDYRYVWIRDASFTIYALLRLGFREEARAFLGWIERCTERIEDASQLAVLYRIDGGEGPKEERLEGWRGYAGSTPVRVGNDARDQLQLDIYGELLDALYLCDKHVEPMAHDLWETVRRLVDWVRENWRRADESIWEVRAGRHHFLYSRVLCWVALDRALRLAWKRSLPCPRAEWEDTRNEIYRAIFDEFWHEEEGCFRQARDVDAVDGASLIMPLVRFIGPADPRWLSHLRAIRERLIDDSLVNRYRLDGEWDDGFGRGEGTFSLCSFWYAEALSRAGDLQQARLVFEKTLGYANHVGLFSEQLGPTAQHLGNFPQALTHVALVSAAYDLNRRLEETRGAG